MKQDTDWAIVSTSYDPLTLYRLIERTIFAQTEDQYERFNTKVDVSEAIGIAQQHKVLLDYVAQESYIKSFEGLGLVEQKLVRVLIPQVRSAHKYPISPWEMIHLPGGDYAVGR
jgi:hypothetical protein